jgi:hypothetical protein
LKLTHCPLDNGSDQRPTARSIAQGVGQNLEPTPSISISRLAGILKKVQPYVAAVRRWESGYHDPFANTWSCNGSDRHRILYHDYWCRYWRANDPNRRYFGAGWQKEGTHSREGKSRSILSAIYFNLTA